MLRHESQAIGIVDEFAMPISAVAWDNVGKRSRPWTTIKRFRDEIRAHIERLTSTDDLPGKLLLTRAPGGHLRCVGD
jgi:hypothetical protein